MDWLFDKRILERNIQKGLLNPKDLEKRLKSLPDLSEQIATDDERGDDAYEKGGKQE
jgi:hypothetical protein